MGILGGEVQETSPVGSYVNEENVCRNATTSSETVPTHFEPMQTELPSIDDIMPNSDGTFRCPKKGCKPKVLFYGKTHLR